MVTVRSFGYLHYKYLQMLWETYPKALQPYRNRVNTVGIKRDEQAVPNPTVANEESA